MHARWIISITLGLAIAGLVTPAWGGRPEPQQGAQCTLVESGWVTKTLSDIQLSDRVFAAGDMAAYDKLISANRLLINQASRTVFVQRRVDFYVEIRPQGELDTLWTWIWIIECLPDGHDDEAAARKGK
jgi:hypothetical protein